MNLLQALLILQARSRIALGTLLTVLVTGVAITLLSPKQYTATTTVVFDVKSPDPVAGQLLPVQPGYIATQVEIISSDRVAQRVAKTLQLSELPAVRADWMQDTGGKGKIDVWLGELLVKKLTVVASRESSMIHIGYTGADPAFAAVVANAFAQAYLDANIELRVDPARQYARWFGEQGKTLRDTLEKAQTRLSEFQQLHGIVAKDEKLDAETTTLNELTSQLNVISSETSDAKSKQRSGSDTLPEVMKDSVIVGLKSDIARQEGKVQEAAGNLGKNHPQYLRMVAELDTLKQQLRAETERVTGGYSSARSVSRDKEADLRAAIAAQEKKLLEIKFQRDQLAVLQRDVDAAQSAYETVTKRYNQATLESQMTQTNASVLNQASEPTEPSFPNIRKGLLLSLLAAVLLGGAAAFLVEFLDRRVRSVDDLEQMLHVPVLGVIRGGTIQTLELVSILAPQTGAGARVKAMDQSDAIPVPDAGSASRRDERPIGVILVHAERLSSDSAERILQTQREGGQRFGDAGIQLGLLNDADVDFALSRQFDCPYLAQGESRVSQRVIAAYLPSSPQAIAIGALRNQIMLRWCDGAADHKMLALVSAERRDGRSYIAANLAVAFSQLGQKTLLIDADMRNADQHALFGIENRAGLSAILSGRGIPEALIHQIPGLPGLSVLPAGTRPPNPLELLARPLFPQLLGDLAGRYDVILLDSPAASQYADAQTVTLRARAALVVARKDVTRLQRMRGISDATSQGSGTVIGTVLNDF